MANVRKLKIESKGQAKISSFKYLEIGTLSEKITIDFFVSGFLVETAENVSGGFGVTAENTYTAAIIKNNNDDAIEFDIGYSLLGDVSFNISVVQSAGEGGESVIVINEDDNVIPVKVLNEADKPVPVSAYIDPNNNSLLNAEIVNPVANPVNINLPDYNFNHINSNLILTRNIKNVFYSGIFQNNSNATLTYMLPDAVIAGGVLIMSNIKVTYTYYSNAKLWCKRGGTGSLESCSPSVIGRFSTQGLAPRIDVSLTRTLSYNQSNRFIDNLDDIGTIETRVIFFKHIQPIEVIQGSFVEFNRTGGYLTHNNLGTITDDDYNGQISVSFTAVSKEYVLEPNTF